MGVGAGGGGVRVTAAPGLQNSSGGKINILNFKKIFFSLNVF